MATTNKFEGATIVTLAGVNGLQRRRNRRGETFGAPRFLQPASADVIKSITDENGFILGTAEKADDLRSVNGHLWVAYEATDEDLVEQLEAMAPVKGAPMTYELYVAFRANIDRDHRDGDDRVYTTVGAVILGVKAGKLFNAATDGGFIVRDRQVPVTTAAVAPAAATAQGAEAGLMTLLSQLANAGKA